MSDAARTDAVIVLTSLPDRGTALQLARALVEKRLAACVSVLAECTSVYRWKGGLETAQEVPVQIKTRGALYPEVEAVIREHHPYELPEIVAVPVVRGLPKFLEWVAAETNPPTG
jgi:periplasmic divalent cation tolerance protein